MKHRLPPIIAACSLVLAACSDGSKDDNAVQSQSALCLSFVDKGIGMYAMQNWDTNHDQCIDASEADAVTAIPALAFANNAQVQSLDDLSRFPNLTTIGNGAFSGCTNLATANIPSVTTIGNSAFAGCTGLTTVNSPNATAVGDAAFSGCTNLGTVNIPAQNPPTSQCTEGARKCSENGMQSLVCVRGNWAILENCPKGCKDNVCIVDTPMPACDEGAQKCSDSSALVIVCKDGHWIFKENCTNGCTDGVCHVASPVICPDKCKDNCDANGLCVDIVTPTCPSSCKNGCDDFGNCKPDEVTCPSSCKNGCDDKGNCKPEEVTCPSSCKNGCDDKGNCKPDEVTCPSSCKKGCDDKGNCKPDEVTCPSSCKNGCDDDGNCKPAEVTCPTSCKDGCDDDGNCKSPVITCQKDFPKDGSVFDCGDCVLSNPIRYSKIVSSINIVNPDAFCQDDQQIIGQNSIQMSNFCQPENIALCSWNDHKLIAECYTPCSEQDAEQMILTNYDNLCLYSRWDEIWAWDEILAHLYQCTSKNGYFVYKKIKDFYDYPFYVGDDKPEIIDLFHQYVMYLEKNDCICDDRFYCYEEWSYSGYWVGKHEPCTQGDRMSFEEVCSILGWNPDNWPDYYRNSVYECSGDYWERIGPDACTGE